MGRAPVTSSRSHGRTGDRWRLSRPNVAVLILFAVAYVAAGGLGQGLQLIPGVSITFWPPAGIFLAALILTSPRDWPWYVLAGCLAELTGNAVWFHNPVHFALIYFTANALEAVVAAWLLHRFRPRPFRLDSLEDALAFVVLAAGVAPVVGATVIATTDALIGKHAFTTAWPLVWLGDATGLLVATPLVKVAVRAWQDRSKIPRARLLEGAAIATLLVALGTAAFTGHAPTPYVLFPPLLWAAVRFQLRGAAVSLGAIVLMAAGFAVARRGAVGATPGSAWDSVVDLQMFLGIAAVSGLFVAALAAQRLSALAALKDANEELETRVAERTASLRNSEERLDAALRSSSAAPWGWDVLADRLDPWTPAYRAMYGFRDDEPCTFATWISRVHPDDRARLGARVRRMLETPGDDVWDEDFRIVHPDKGVRWIGGMGRVLRDAHGRAVRMTGVNLDITERKHTEAELHLHREHLQQLVDEQTRELALSYQRLRLSERLAAVGTLAAGLAHDIGNLVVPIRVRVEAMETMELPERARAELAGIAKAVEYVQHLARGLRLLVVDPGRDACADPADLRTWWRDVEPVLKTTLAAGVSLRAQLPEGEIWVAATPAALTQAVFNLVQNASDAIGETGTGTVTVGAERSETHVTVWVADDGPGMSEEVRQRCLEPLFTTKPGDRGTGLGLPLVHRLVNEWGGTLRLESTPGAGSTFRLSIPLAPPPPRPAKPRRASVVLDNARLRAVVAAELESLAYDVRYDPPSDGQADVVVTDRLDLRRPDDVPVVVLGEIPERYTGLTALGPRPKVEVLRETLRAIARGRRPAAAGADSSPESSV